VCQPTQRLHQKLCPPTPILKTDVIETDETMDAADSTLLISAEPGVFENEGIVKYIMEKS